MEIDLRSEEPRLLAELDGRVREAIDGAVAAERARWPSSSVPLTVAIETTGFAPQAVSPSLGRSFRWRARRGGSWASLPELGASSTDANIPISLGIPAITISGGGPGRRQSLPGGMVRGDNGRVSGSAMGRSDRGDAGRGKVVPYGRSHIYGSDPLPSLPDRGAALLLALRRSPVPLQCGTAGRGSTSRPATASGGDRGVGARLFVVDRRAADG